MIALYERAAARCPDDLAVAVALGRVYFELSMLDEAADQFEKVEVRAPSLPVLHGYLGAVFERRGPGPRRPARSTAARSTPSSASSGRIAARRAGPTTRAGRIGARHAVGGTRSGS